MTSDTPAAHTLVLHSPLAHARVTGLVGVVMLAAGIFAGTVQSRLVAPGDNGATARNILESETLFRLGIASGLLMMVMFLFYGLLLYRLLRPAHANAAMFMVALVGVSVPIYMLNQVNQYAVLLAARHQPEQIQLFLDLHQFGNLIGAIFFGLWLFPLGFLVFRSGFIPRFLGVLLMVGSPGYVLLFVQAFCLMEPAPSLWANPLLVLTHLAELALLVWLLVRGLNADRWRRRAGASPAP